MISTCLFFIAATTQAPTPLPHTDPVFVEITEGRGTLLAGDRTKALSAGGGEQWVEGRGHLSIMASSKATLRWHGRASLQLDGPCELEWAPCDPMEGLEWNFHQVTRAAVETRLGHLRIILGSRWSVSVPPGALSLRALPNAGYEVLQEAGAPATYQWKGPLETTRPDREGIIGKPVRLGSNPPAARNDHSALLSGRSTWTWPWRDEPTDVERWGYRDWPWVPQRPKHVTVYVDRSPTPTTMQDPSQKVFTTVDTAPVASEPTREPAYVITDDTGQDPITPMTSPDGDGTWGWESDQSSATGPWRGVAEENYQPEGEYFIQRETGVFSEELEDGGIRFWIPEHYVSSGWVLGPRLDSRLDPGSSIEFGPSGTLRAHSGGVRVLAALER